jgi:alpha-beta hydrolase superfamily lysophospholipase
MESVTLTSIDSRRSGGTQQGVTIAGEMLDLQAAVAWATSRPAPLSIVATSFGAVSTTLSLRWLDSRMHGLVLWCPVLDLRHTFIEPELPCGVENFGPLAQQQLDREGYLLVDDDFALGRVLFDEMRHYQPRQAFASSATSVHRSAPRRTRFP